MPYKDKVFNTSHNGYARSEEIFINIDSKDYIEAIAGNKNTTNIDGLINIFLKEIEDTLHHELSHVMQRKIKNNKEFLPGLPPKVKNTHDASGFDKNQERTQDHELRSIEVYPRLGDSIRDFNLATKNMKESDKNKFLLDFIGANGIKHSTDGNFADVLKNKNPRSKDIYKIMVKSFLKMVNA